jgi:hypothetical protein
VSDTRERIIPGEAPSAASVAPEATEAGEHRPLLAAIDAYSGAQVEAHAAANSDQSGRAGAGTSSAAG